MKLIHLIFFLLSSSCFGDATLENEIEIKSAKISGCSMAAPCSITVEKTHEGYFVRVKASVLITMHGILKYKTGSTDYHQFNNDGIFIGTKHTT